MISEKPTNSGIGNGSGAKSVLSSFKISMRRYTVVLFSITLFFLFADQNLLAPNLALAGHEFGMSDSERDAKLGGDIALGFFIVGGPVALLVGYFADVMKRNVLFGIVVFCGSMAGLCTYWVTTYEQLFFCRILTGVSIGGVTPIVYSMLGDLYAHHQRVYLSTLIGISQAAGVASGQFLAGMIGPTIGWRIPFVIVAIPSLCCAFLVLLTVEEAKRGGQEKAVKEFAQISSAKQNSMTDIEGNSKKALITHPSPDSSTIVKPTPSYQNPTDETKSLLSSPPSNTTVEAFIEFEDDIVYSEEIEWNKILDILKTPSALIIYLQGFPGCVPWGMIGVFLNNYLSEHKEMSIAHATGILTLFSVGGLLGQLFGGYLGQRLYNRDPRLQTLLMGFTTILSVGPLLYLINAAPAGGDHTRLLGYYLVAFLGGFIVNINGPNVRVVLQVKGNIQRFVVIR
jgi:MFS family permease